MKSYSTTKILKENNLALKEGPVEGIKHQSMLKEDPTKGWIYAVGNVNGNPTLLNKMISQIEGCSLARNDKIVFLGNFISEIGNNKEVINILREYQSVRPDQVVIIRGAREQHMVLSRKSFFTSDLGKNTLKQYTTHNALFHMLARSRFDKADFVNARTWLDTLPCYYKSKKYFFTHSGVNPMKDLGKQEVGGLMFIQDLFYKSDRQYEKVIVHTMPTDHCHFKSHRIGIGQHPTKGKGVLSCYILNDQWPDMESARTPFFGKTIEGMLRVES